MKIDASIKPDRKGRFGDVTPWEEQYRMKTVTGEEAAAQVRDGDFVFTCGATNFPQVVMDALVKHLAKNKYHIDMYSTYIITDEPILKPEYKDNLELYTMFMGGERKLQDQGNLQYIPAWMSDVGRIIKARKPRVGIFRVSPPNEDGWMSRSIWTHHFGKEAYLNDSCEVVIVEVNKNFPFINSAGPSVEHTFIHVSEVDFIVESDNELLQVKAGASTEDENTIAGYVADLIKDGDCIQIGLGGLADAVGTLLVQSGKKDLGLWSELLTNGLYDLIEAGVITNAKKNIYRGKSVVATLVGDSRLWKYADNNPDILLLEGPYINDIRNIARNDNVVSINNTMDIDLQGQANSEAMGFRQYSGTGGQLEFVIGSQMSKGGKSILCLNSTYKDKKGNLVSKIKPTLDPGSPVTTPRSIINYVITEYGVVNLRYKSLKERAELLISIAHPQFRDELTADAKKCGLLR